MSELETKYLEVPFKIEKKGIVEIDGEQFFEFEGYASVFNNVDLGNDRVMPGAFAGYISDVNTGSKELPPALWQHNSDSPVGIYPEMKEDDKGLFVKARLPMEDTFVSGRVVPQIKVKSVKALSIGYRTLKSTFVEEDDELVRNLEELDLWEISLVTFPMNEQAKITSIKSIEQTETLSDVETILKQKGFSNKESKAIISRIAELKTVRDEPEVEPSDDGLKLQEAKELIAEFEHNMLGE